MKFKRPTVRSVVASADQTGYRTTWCPVPRKMSYHRKYILLRVAPLTETQGVKAGDAAAFRLCQNCLRTASIGAVWDAF